MKNNSARYSKEALFLKYLCDQMDEAARIRFSNLVYWYVRHARINKFFFYACTLGASLSSLAITFLNACGLGAVWITLISCGTLLMNVLLSLFCFQANWKRYRHTAEILKREASSYVNRIGVYQAEEAPDSTRKLFLARLEALAMDENVVWEQQKPKVNIG